MNNQSIKKVAVFIDASNLYHATKENGWKIDFKKLSNYLDVFGKSMGRYYFTPTPAYHNTTAVAKYRKFKKALIFMGYTVKDKELKEIRVRDKNGKILIKPKADLDTEISNWMDNVYRDYHIAIVIGGDSDYAHSLEKMVTDGKYVIVISNQNNTSIESQNIAHKFIDLKDLEDKIKRE